MKILTFIHRYPLLSFFVLVFVLTWPFLIVDALGSHGILSFRLSMPMMLLMSYMPTMAAVLVTNLISGRAGVRNLLRQLLIWRVNIGWYVVAIGGFAFFCIAAILLAIPFSNTSAVPFLAPEVANSSGAGLVLMVLLLFVVTTLVNGEELAWRGFALPRLQAKWNALTSSLILGVVWALFHLPLFFTLNTSESAARPFGSFFLSTVAVSVLFTWLYNHTNGSVLLAYLFHGAANTWTRVFAIEQGGAAVNWSLAIVLCLAAVVVVLVFGFEHLHLPARSSHNQFQPSKS